MLRIVTPWESQPQEVVGVDWGSSLLEKCICVFDGAALRTKELDRVSASYNTSSGLVQTPYGVGTAFAGTSNSVLRYGLATTLSASDPMAIEILLYGSEFPSLSILAAVTNVGLSTGIVNGAVDAGVVRGVMAFGGTAPCNVFAWGGSQDFDSGDALKTQTLQHILVTRAAGTGAVRWSIYQNGALVGQGNSSNIAPWASTGSHFYIGGRHLSGTVSMTATVLSASLYRREISAAEVAVRYSNPWSLFAPRTIWVPVSSASSGTSFTITPNGGIAFGGTSVDVKGKILTVSGGVTFSGTGSATFASGGTTYTITPTGGLTFAGSGASVNSKVFLPSGGITFAGSGLSSRGKIVAPAGGVLFGGTGSMSSNTSIGAAQTGERTKVGVGT